MRHILIVLLDEKNAASVFDFFLYLSIHRSDPIFAMFLYIISLPFIAHFLELNSIVPISTFSRAFN